MEILKVLQICIFLTLVIKTGHVLSTGKERIVTDTLSVTKNGAPVDYSYNQSSVTGEYSSAPGCPKSVDGYPWVIFGNPPRCYIAGLQGPCPIDMKLFVVSNSNTGVCDCDCFSKSESSSTKSHCLIEGQQSHVAFFAPKQQCYQLFSQGPCAGDQWFVLNSNIDKPICEKRKCPVVSLSNYIFTFFDNVTNECKEIGDRCETSYSGEGTYQINEFKWIPQCMPVIASSIAFGVSSDNSCPFEQKFSSILMKCVKKFDSIQSIGK